MIDIKKELKITIGGFFILIFVLFVIFVIGKVLCALVLQEFCSGWSMSFVVGVWTSLGILLCYIIGEMLDIGDKMI